MKGKSKYLVPIVLVLVFIMSLVGCTASDPLVFGDLPSSEDLYAQGNVHLDGDVYADSYYGDGSNLTGIEGGGSSNAFKNNPATTEGLTYGYFGGTVILNMFGSIGPVVIPDGAIEVTGANENTRQVVFNILTQEPEIVDSATWWQIALASVTTNEASITQFSELLVGDALINTLPIYGENTEFGLTPGLVPASVESTGAYLKDDGTWDTPAGGSGLDDFANDPATTSGLTWGYKAGVVKFNTTQGDALIELPLGSIELTDDSENYIYVSLQNEEIYTSSNAVEIDSLLLYWVYCEDGEIFYDEEEEGLAIVDYRNALYSVPNNIMTEDTYLNEDGKFYPSSFNYYQYIDDTLTEPTAEDEGMLKIFNQGDGLPSIVYICLKNSSDEYVWVQLATGDD